MGKRKNTKTTLKKVRSKNMRLLPGRLQTVAIAKRARGRPLAGKFGAASEVKHIDPSEWAGDE